MRKKIVMLIALVTVVALCAITLAACVPTSVGAYMEALKKTDHATIKYESLGSSIAFDGDNMHIVVDTVGVKMEYYIITKSNKMRMYFNIGGVWAKTEASAQIKKTIEQFDNSKLIEEFDTNKENYDIKDGVWTEKKSGTMFKIEDRKLVSYNVVANIQVKYVTIDLAKPSMALPDDAKALD